MSILADEIARALAELQRITSDEDGQVTTFTWNGQTIACRAGKITKRSMFGGGGLTPEDDLRLDVDLSLLPSEPQPGQLLTFEGESWRIDRTEKQPGDSMLSLFCNDPNRGAGFREREM